MAIYNSIGEDMSKTFLVPEQDYLPQARSLPTAGRPSSSRGSQAKFDFPDPEEGLYNLDGVTSEYFQKYQDLRSYAQNMHNQYGIDVTSPNHDSPEAMRASITFMKAMADLNYTADRLKNEQELFKTNQGKVTDSYLDGEGRFNQGFDASSSLPTDRNVSQQFQTTVTPEVDDFNERIGGKVYDINSGGYKQAMAEYDRMKAFYEGEIARADAQGNSAEAERNRLIVNKLVKPTGQVKWDPNKATRDRNSVKKVLGVRRVERATNILSGNQEAINSLQDNPNVVSADMNASGDKIIVRMKDGSVRNISRKPEDSNSALATINSMINGIDGEEDVSFDDIMNLNTHKVEELSRGTWYDEASTAPTASAVNQIVSNISRPSTSNLRFDPTKELPNNPSDEEIQAFNDSAPVRGFLSSVRNGNYSLPIGAGKRMPVEDIEYIPEDDSYVVKVMQTSGITQSEMDAADIEIDKLDERPIIKVSAKNKKFWKDFIENNRDAVGSTPFGINYNSNSSFLEGAKPQDFGGGNNQNTDVDDWF